MMRFGTLNSPVLLEAMGDVLHSSYLYDRKGPRHHAALAYLAASKQVKTEKGKELLRQKAGGVLSVQGVVVDQSMMGPDGVKKLPVLDAELDHLLKQAETYRERVHQLEQTWIRNGEQPDKKFHAFLADPASFLPDSMRKLQTSEKRVSPF